MSRKEALYGADHTKAIIEISKDSKSKYEVDKESGLLSLDRELTLPYPANYGFVPRTLSADGDALDIFVVSHYPIDPLTVVRYKLVGMVDMLDQGVRDEKLVATLPGYDGEVDLREIAVFLSNYKEGTEIIGLHLTDAGAHDALTRARLTFLESVGNE